VQVYEIQQALKSDILVCLCGSRPLAGVGDLFTLPPRDGGQIILVAVC